jgi:hypothetical protein
MEPTSAWQVKRHRAEEHRAELQSTVSDYLARGYRIAAESNATSNETYYRLHVLEPIPARISAIIGDVLHNLRSALDCLSLELARRHLGRDLNLSEERGAQFPISKSHKDFDTFFNRPGRADLFSRRERMAMQSTQPGWVFDLAAQSGIQSGNRDEEVEHDSLWLLQQLSNADKHRRVLVTFMHVDQVWWASDAHSEYGWRWGRTPFHDGQVVGVLTDTKGYGPPELREEVELRVNEPSAPRASEWDVNSLMGQLSGRVERALWQTCKSWSESPV